MLKLIRFDASQAIPIDGFDSVGSSAVHLGSGSGESHSYAVHIGPGGEIGFHEAGFGQLFIVSEGEGWVATPDERTEVARGEAVLIERGTIHAKGSANGLLAIMVQIGDMQAVGH
ncbi:MAG: cupin domain-containing protein [Acidimicrobiales bacterium]